MAAARRPTIDGPTSIDAGSPERPSTDYTIDAVVACLQVILMLEEPPHRMKVSEIARHLGTSRNRAFRLVKTLESEGFVFRHDDGYGVGVRLAQFMRKVDAENDVLAATARPALRDLTALTGESSYLAILTPDGQCLCAMVVESDAHIRSVPVLGLVSPLNAGAAAKVLFAFQPPDRRQELSDQPLPLHNSNSKDGQGLLDEVAVIARDRYSTALEEFHLGVDSVGAPIWTEGGAVVAAIGLVGPSTRIRPDLPTPLAEQVLDAARVVSGKLGGNPDTLPDVP